MVLVLGLGNWTLQSASFYLLLTSGWALQHVLGQSAQCRLQHWTGLVLLLSGPLVSSQHSSHQSQLDCLVQVMCKAFSPDCCRGHTTDIQSQISSSHALRTDSPVPPPIGSALMCLLEEVYVHGEGWSHLFRVKGGSSPVAASSEG